MANEINCYTCRITIILFYQVQHEQNGGKCGACGDDFSGVKENEPGPENRYAQGVITAKYTAGQMGERGRM